MVRLLRLGEVKNNGGGTRSVVAAFSCGRPCPPGTVPRANRVLFAPGSRKAKLQVSSAAQRFP